MEGQDKKKNMSPIEDSSIPSYNPSTYVINIPTTSSSGTDYPVMKQLLAESYTFGIARKVLLEHALRDYDIEYFCVHQYTFTYEVTILSPWLFIP